MEVCLYFILKGWEGYLSHLFFCFLVCSVLCILNLILQFEDARDAQDAIYYRDGYDFDGYRLRVRIFSLSSFFFYLPL